MKGALDLEWNWDEADPASMEGGATLAVDGGDRLLLEIVADAPTAVVRRQRPSGQAAWTATVPLTGETAGALAWKRPFAFVALLPAHATGCRLLGFEVATGRRLWDVGLEGLGPVGHGKYSNRVQLAAGDGSVVVLGDESGGRYIEARAAKDGRHLGHRRISR